MRPFTLVSCHYITLCGLCQFFSSTQWLSFILSFPQLSYICYSQTFCFIYLCCVLLCFIFVSLSLPPSLPLSLPPSLPLSPTFLYSLFLPPPPPPPPPPALYISPFLSLYSSLSTLLLSLFLPLLLSLALSFLPSSSCDHPPSTFFTICTLISPFFSFTSLLVFSDLFSTLPHLSIYLILLFLLLSFSFPAFLNATPQLQECTPL